MSELASPYEVASQAVAHLRNRTCGTRALAEICKAPPAFVDDALAPLVDAGKLMRINAFRHGAAEFDYRWSATWVPCDADLALCVGGGQAPLASISPVAPAAQDAFTAPARAPTLPAHLLRPASREERARQGQNGASAKHARDALHRAFKQAPQSLGWAPAPVSPPEQQTGPSEAHTEETTMSTVTHTHRPTKAASARFQICALLMAKGDLTRDELTQDVRADHRALQNALYNAKAAGHVVFFEKTSRFHLTAQGKAWTSGGTNLANPKVAGASPSEAKRGLANSPAPAPTQILVEEARSFRCAVFNDGGFHLSKNGQSVELDAAEHAQMLRYLERMAEQQA